MIVIIIHYKLGLDRSVSARSNGLCKGFSKSSSSICFPILLKPHPHLVVSGFGVLEVACWPLVPKFAGSNPAEVVGFLRVNKNPQHVGGHECLFVVIVVCCQVEVSATI